MSTHIFIDIAYFNLWAIISMPSMVWYLEILFKRIVQMDKCRDYRRKKPEPVILALATFGKANRKGRTVIKNGI